jgi:hypothetical protein
LINRDGSDAPLAAGADLTLRVEAIEMALRANFSIDVGP